MTIWTSGVRNTCVAAVLWASSGLALAQTMPMTMPQNVVQLSASAQREVPQDWLTVTLVHRVQAADAAAVQRQLAQAVDAASRSLRPRVRPGELELSSGSFVVQPRYNREGQVAGWQGSAELIVQGRDIAAIGASASQTPGMVVARMGFSLSHAARRALEDELRREAIGRFQQTARSVASDFGFAGFALREVTIGEQGQEMVPQARLMMAADMQAGNSSLPIMAEPGKTTVHISVSGTVQLQ